MTRSLLRLTALSLLLGSACAPPEPGADEESVLAASAPGTTYEAENATVVGAKILNTSAGFTGTGYVDYQNASGDYVEWTVNATAAASHPLTVRFANGSTARPLELRVNGAVVNAALGFPGTGAWTTWTTVATAANLNVGSNKVRLTATGSNGPNIDNLVVGTPAGAPPPPVVSQSGSPTDDCTPTWSWTSGGGTGSGSYRYKLDSTDLSSGATSTTARTFTPPLPLANGVHVLYVQEKSAGGQWSSSGSASVDVELHLPYAQSGQFAYRATYVGPVSATTYVGFFGAAYVDFQNASGDYLEFTTAVPKDGIYKVTFRYANGGSTSRPLKITVNGVTVKAAYDFPPTGSWTTWKTLTLNMPLTIGGKVRLTAIGSSGGNFDSLSFDSGTPMPPPPVVQAPPNPTAGPMTFSWTSGDPEGTGRYQYSLGQGFTNSTWFETAYPSVTYTGYPLGTYTFWVQEWNKWGTWGKSATVTLDLVNPGPPIISSPPNPVDPGLVHFSWTSGGGNGVYRYRFGDAGNWDATDTTATDAGCTCVYPPGSTQPFQVEELDKSGTWWSLPSTGTYTLTN
jgi:hypothetical protein